MSEDIYTAEATPILSEQVPNYLWQAIVVTVLCCIPLGIPAIVFSSKVNTLIVQGDLDGAKDASSKAKMWCWIALGLGLIGGIISAGAQVFVAIAAENF